MTEATQSPLPEKVAVILTAIQPETEAVLRHLDINQPPERVVDTWFHVGRVGSWTVAVAEAGSGNSPAATIAVRAFTHYKPDIAAFVGVAGGLKDVILGDVVVATKVYGYESGKETPDGFRTRPDVQSSHHELQSRGRVIRLNSSWCESLDPIFWANRKKPNVHVGPIAAGEAVVADNAGRIATHLKLNCSDALAVEMEGRGFLEAAHIDTGCRAVVVRGISDLLIGKARTDRLGWQRRAADAAATFFFKMLAFEKGTENPRNRTGNVSAASAGLMRQARANPDAHITVSRGLPKRTAGHLALSTHIGREVFRALTMATKDSRHLILEDDHSLIGVLLNFDEFNLLMELSAGVSDLAALSDMMRRDEEDTAEGNLTSSEVFGEGNRGDDL